MNGHGGDVKDKKKVFEYVSDLFSLTYHEMVHWHTMKLTGEKRGMVFTETSQPILCNENLQTCLWLNLPGHPAELSDSIKLLLTDAKSYVFDINLVLKSIH